MASRLEFHFLPFVKYTLLLIVYIFAGGFLFFYLEECKYSSVKLQGKKRLFVGNVSSICLRLSGKLFKSVNSSGKAILQQHLLSTKLLFSQCQTLLNSEEIDEMTSNEECSPDWRNVRKWIKFVHNTLATIGYQDIQVQSQVGKILMIIYIYLGIPLSIMCYIHFGRIIRVTIRRCIRRAEGHFFNRSEPRNIRHKVIFYNSVLVIIIPLLAAAILNLDGKQTWSYIDCLYYFTGVITTSGIGDTTIDTEFTNTNTGLSILIEILQLIAVGLASSLIQAATSLKRAKQKRGKLPLKPHQTTNEIDRQDNAQTRHDVNGTVAMDSLVILVRSEQT